MCFQRIAREQICQLNNVRTGVAHGMRPIWITKIAPARFADSTARAHFPNSRGPIHTRGHNALSIRAEVSRSDNRLMAQRLTNGFARLAVPDSDRAILGHSQETQTVRIELC